MSSLTLSDLKEMTSEQLKEITVGQLDSWAINQPEVDALLGAGTCLARAKRAGVESLAYVLYHNQALPEVIAYAREQLASFLEMSGVEVFSTDEKGLFLVDWDSPAFSANDFKMDYEGILIRPDGNVRSFAVSKFTREIYWKWEGGPSDLSQKWKEIIEANEAVQAKTVSTKGRGYSGGHNTAARMGWGTYAPKGQGGAVLWWDTTTQGTWTGYYPSSMSVVPQAQNN